jgi:ATP-dependent Clp protease ATP-binding subunit ClpX
MTKPKNALQKQYQKFFEMENAKLEFTDDALHALAQKALKRDTGARALRAITEELMVDLMYQLPEEEKGAKYVITRDIVEGKADLFTAKKKSKKRISITRRLDPTLAGFTAHRLTSPYSLRLLTGYPSHCFEQ